MSRQSLLVLIAAASAVGCLAAVMHMRLSAVAERHAEVAEAYRECVRMAHAVSLAAPTSSSATGEDVLGLIRLSMSEAGMAAECLDGIQHRQPGGGEARAQAEVRFSRIRAADLAAWRIAWSRTAPDWVVAACTITPATGPAGTSPAGLHAILLLSNTR